MISFQGICSAAGTSSAWAVAVSSAEGTIAAYSLELTGFEGVASKIIENVMKKYCN